MTRRVDDEDLIREAEGTIFSAIRARDTAMLEATLTEDFVHTTLGGEQQDRPAFLAGVREMPYRILEIAGQDLRVRVLGDVALLSGIQRARVALDGKTITALTAFVDVFARTTEGWRLRHAASVELPAPEERNEPEDQSSR